MVHVMKKKTSLDIEYFLLFCDELSSLQIINHFIRNTLQKNAFFWEESKLKCAFGLKKCKSSTK
jgi:hypothetical protein